MENCITTFLKLLYRTRMIYIFAEKENSILINKKPLTDAGSATKILEIRWRHSGDI